MLVWRPALFQYDLILIDYIFKDPSSQKRSPSEALGVRMSHALWGSTIETITWWEKEAERAAVLHVEN